MAKLCPNCKNQIEDDAVFCENCGTRLDAQPADPSVQSPMQSYNQPIQQYPQQSQQYTQYGNPQQPANKSPGLLISLIVGGITLLAAIAAIVVFVVLPMLNPKGVKTEPVDSASLADQFSQEPAKESEFDFTDLTTDLMIESDGEDTVTESVDPFEDPFGSRSEESAAISSQPEVKLPYTDSLGKINASDFAWISDAMSGSLSGSFLSNDDLLGKWKGEFTFGEIWELVYVTINTDGTVVVEPYKINYGDEWEDESGNGPYIFNGSFDINRVYGSGDFGKIDIYQFLESNGTQYATGKFNTKTGNEAAVYLVRP